jgi:hypothetical protein
MTKTLSPSIAQRIDHRVNTAGLGATAWILGKLEDFNPPRWLYRGFFIAWISVFIAELKGNLTFQGWLDAFLSLVF